MVPSLVNSHDALIRLQEGNNRFVAGLRSIESLASARRLAELAEKGQRPFAAILACADSRVPTEAIFDCGIGELFVTRVAGNVVSPHMIASLEYACTMTGTSLIVVLGHTGCGAIKAALDATGAKKNELTHSLQVLVDDMRPAVEAAKAIDHLTPYPLVNDVERQNVRLGCESLVSESPTLAKLVKEGRIRIAGALCDTRTAKVEFGLEQPVVAPTANGRAAFRKR